MMKMQSFFHDHSAGFHTVEPQKIWRDYTEDYYQMDTYYRKFHLCYIRCLKASNIQLDDLFKHVVDQVEGLYSVWFLGGLAGNWTNAAGDELALKGHIDNVPLQESFYSVKVKSADSKVYVIVSDALRYEVAAEIAQLLRQETQSKVELSGMIGVFRLESQMLPGNGKFERTGFGSDREPKEASNTAFNFLKANGNRISGSISTTTKDYIINYQDLQGIGMTKNLALPTLVALCSIVLGKPALSSLAILGEISISGTMIKADELANALQVCLDSGAKKVLLPITSAGDLGTVPAELVGCFNLIFYQSAEDAVFKALGVE